MQLESRGSSRDGRQRKSLFFVEYGLGHKTHLRFLQQHLADDARFNSTVIPLHWMDGVGDFLGKLHVPPLGNRGLDLGTWITFQFKRQQVGWFLRRHKPEDLDLVYIHTQTAATSVLDLPRSVPAVVSIDLTWKLAFEEARFATTPFLQHTLDLERRIFERADLVVSFSEWAANSVIEDYGIPASRVQVVRNGITLPKANGNGHHRNGNGNGHHKNGNGNGHHKNGNGNGKHAIGDDLLKIGFVGNDFTRKGGDLLLQVHQEHFADRAHLTLVSGDVPRGSQGLPNVKVRTKVPWDELMTDVLPAWDLFVFPTRYDYSPYAVIEAMSAGVPVISTRVGAIPEMIEDGQSGFLIAADEVEPLVDRMDWALNNRAALPEMGARAKARAEDQYAAERNYPLLMDVLAGVRR